MRKKSNGERRMVEDAVADIKARMEAERPKRARSEAMVSAKVEYGMK